MRYLALILLLLPVPASRADEPSAAPSDRVVQVSLVHSSAPISGQIVQEAGDGSLLIEDRAGRLHICDAANIKQLDRTQQQFTYLTREEMASHLLQQTGADFAVRLTDHFVICSSASELYTDFCARLLEKVVREFQQLTTRLKLPTRPLPTQLPVIIFRRSEELTAFAQRQHPEISFDGVPGYYSLFHNQMLVAGISGDRTFSSRGDVVRELRRNLRQVETIVHEGVHQLAFNSGLQVRLADNPMWFSEGLAVYFEHTSGVGNALWSGPGGVNRIHHPTFARLSADGTFHLPVESLVRTDAAFQSEDPATVAAAYAESWALVYYLIRREPQAFRSYAQRLQQLQPLQPIRAEQRWEAFRSVITDTENGSEGNRMDELERRVVRSVRRLRVR